MSTKIIAWSMRCRRARTCGVQLPVWYVALVPKRPASDSAKSAGGHVGRHALAQSTSASPAGIDTTKAARWIRPRHCGFGEDASGSIGITSGYGPGEGARARDNGRSPSAILLELPRVDRAGPGGRGRRQADRRPCVPAGATGRQGRPGRVATAPGRPRSCGCWAAPRRPGPASSAVAAPPGTSPRTPVATRCPTTPRSSPTCSPGRGLDELLARLEKLRVAMDENPSQPQHRALRRRAGAVRGCRWVRGRGGGAQARGRRRPARRPARRHPRRALRR